mmetsp:Transcript_42719/g.70491  ORF Transcript_42719/g.70491 Transcript_42719/m.70491 type:complete len:163 (+) Transcript_42719:73-561(+)
MRDEIETRLLPLPMHHQHHHRHHGHDTTHHSDQMQLQLQSPDVIVKLHSNSKSQSQSKTATSGHVRDQSLTLSQTWTEDSSMYFAEFLAPFGPLESHHNQNRMSQSSSLLLVTHDEHSDETEESQSQLSLKALKQSVTLHTEITTIQEEDESEHADEEMKVN